MSPWQNYDKRLEPYSLPPTELPTKEDMVELEALW
jgi:hypothetical protein